MQNDKHDKAFRLARHQVQRPTDAMNINSIGCIQLYFRLNRACGRTCNVEKGLGPLHRPAFPRGNKSSCGRPGACQSKAIWIMAKAEFGLSEPAGKHWEKLQRCLNFARLRASALRYMQLPAVCLARRDHGKNKMSAKCLLQIICIQSVKENLWTWIELAKIPT